MALGRTEQPVEAISGSVGNVTFRTKVRTTALGVKSGNRKPRSTRQIDAAKAAQTVAGLWRAMTDPQRAAWEDLAEQLQYIEDPLVVGKVSGWQVYSGHARRWLLTGTAPPNTPSAFGGQIPDPPWLKFYPLPTPGQFRVFADPQNTMPAPGNQRFLLYAGNARPGSRLAYRRDERYRQFWTDATLPPSGAPVTVTLASDKPWRAGDVCNVRALTISDVGWTSRSFGWTIGALPPGRSVAAIVWVEQILDPTAGWELDPSGFLRVWGFDYPTGAPDVLDLNTPGVKTVGDVAAFFAGIFPFTTLTVSGALLSRPWTQLVPSNRRHQTAKDGAIVLEVNT